MYTKCKNLRQINVVNCLKLVHHLKTIVGYKEFFQTFSKKYFKLYFLLRPNLLLLNSIFTQNLRN